MRFGMTTMAKEPPDRFRRLVEVAEAGDVVSIEPDERHWHGADREEPMTHLAINIDATTTWLHKVSDAEYDG